MNHCNSKKIRVHNNRLNHKLATAAANDSLVLDLAEQPWKRLNPVKCWFRPSGTGRPQNHRRRSPFVRICVDTRSVPIHVAPFHRPFCVPIYVAPFHRPFRVLIYEARFYFVSQSVSRFQIITSLPLSAYALQTGLPASFRSTRDHYRVHPYLLAIWHHKEVQNLTSGPNLSDSRNPATKTMLCPQALAGGVPMPCFCAAAPQLTTVPP